MTTLGRRQIDEFFAQGFTLVGGVFGPAEVAELGRCFERLEARAEQLGRTTTVDGSRFVVAPRGKRGVSIHRVVWCGAVEPRLETCGRDPRLLQMAATLLNSREMVHLINQAHFKKPGDGVAFPWHQDSSNRRYGQPAWRDVNGRGSYVQTVTAIDPVTPDNGPLMFLPGSGSRGHLGLPVDGELPAALDERNAVAPSMQPGDVLLFGPYTVHRSLPNESSVPRRVLINGYAYPGANSRVYPGCGRGRPVVAADVPRETPR